MEGHCCYFFELQNIKNTFKKIFFNSMTNHFLDDGRYLTKLGDGGCRGHDWDRKGCPKFLGRKTLTECAWECRRSEFW